MGTREVKWVNSLPKQQVRGVERDVLEAMAKLTKGYGACFASNETIARLAGTTRRHVIRCKQSLIPKGLLLEEQGPRFPTETRWYVLPVASIKVRRGTCEIQDDLRTSSSDSLSPYSDLREEKTKVRVTSSPKTAIQLHQRVGVSEQKKNNADSDTDQRKRWTHSPNKERVSGGLRTSTHDRKTTANIDDAMFVEFWNLYPNHKVSGTIQEVRDVFFRMVSSHGQAYFELVMRGLQEAIAHNWDGTTPPMPRKWLTDRRWRDEYTRERNAPKVGSV